MNTRNWISEVFSAHADLLEFHNRNHDEEEAAADITRATVIRGVLSSKFGEALAQEGHADFLRDIDSRKSWRAPA